MADSMGQRLLWALRRAVTQTARQQSRARRHIGRRPVGRSPEPSSPPLTTDYPGDFSGKPEIIYAPHPGSLPDPGEVVWGWVPYEEDYSRGKDRPILLIGRDGHWLLGLPLTSKDHERDAEQEAAAGRYWVDIGTGDWDRQRRPSEVRVDRIIRVDPSAVRRTAGKLDRERFGWVADGVRRHWQD